MLSRVDYRESRNSLERFSHRLADLLDGEPRELVFGEFVGSRAAEDELSGVVKEPVCPFLTYEGEVPLGNGAAGCGFRLAQACRDVREHDPRTPVYLHSHVEPAVPALGPEDHVGPLLECRVPESWLPEDRRVAEFIGKYVEPPEPRQVLAAPLATRLLAVGDVEHVEHRLLHRVPVRLLFSGLMDSGQALDDVVEVRGREFFHVVHLHREFQKRLEPWVVLEFQVLGKQHRAARPSGVLAVLVVLAAARVKVQHGRVALGSWQSFAGIHENDLCSGCLADELLCHPQAHPDVGVWPLVAHQHSDVRSRLVEHQFHDAVYELVDASILGSQE